MYVPRIVLQRTSVWMENLEGGLDYLKEVVIDDKLNIAEELENEMTTVVGTFQCEWKTTIENPEKTENASSTLLIVMMKIITCCMCVSVGQRPPSDRG